MFSYKTAMGATALSVVAILAGLSFINQQFVKSSLVSNLDADEMNNEVEEFNIKFSEIEYYEDSAEKIKVALNGASRELSPQEEEILNNL